jgi:MFS family permease
MARVRLGREESAEVGVVSTVAVPGLRLLYGAEVVSGLGDGVFWVALVVFVSRQPDVGLWLALAAVARLAPRALLSLPAGVLADRVNLRRLLVAAEAARGALMLLVAPVVALDGPPALVLLVVLVAYVVGVPSRPGLSAAIPAVAGESHLAASNAVISAIRQTMTVLGPLVGVAVVLGSPALGFVVNGLTFVAGALLISLVRGFPTHPRGLAAPSRHALPVRMVTAFGDAVSAIRRIPATEAVLGLVALLYFVRGTEMVLHVYVVRDQLGEPASWIGLLSGAVGLGAVVAMPVAARAAGRDHAWAPVLLSVVLTAVPTAVLATITSTALAWAVLLLVGFAMVVFEVVIVVLVQRVTAPDELGRVFGGVNAAANAGKLAGALAAPLAVAGLGVAGSLLGVAALTLVLGSLLAVALVPAGRTAAARRRALAPTVDVLATIGLFDGAPRVALERLAASVEEVHRSAGTVVMTQGGEADDLYVCRAGQLDVEVDGRTINRMGAQDWFGEIGLLEARRRTATVRAASDVLLWRIPGEAFLRALATTASAPSALVDGIADRLAATPEPARWR